MIVLFEILYVTASLLLAVYGLNSLYMIYRYLRVRKFTPQTPEMKEWPRVTVQLPIFNEMHTVNRLLEAVSRLKYPRHLLEIQILDDSTDETTIILKNLVDKLKSTGLDIVYLHRTNRQHYKAGALAESMKSAKGDFLAIFDADFVPPEDFLLRVMPWFSDEGTGCVQGRWTHINRDYSFLTRLQALAIDGHFIIEQTVRSRSKLFLNFNGTAGVWRKTCIEDSGGWRAETLTEDLDLSYRAQLKGWKIGYLPDVAVPAELPAQMSAFKRQQARWAKGSLQTARRLARPLLTAKLPLRVKIQGIIHLTYYLVHPLMLAVFFLALPLSLLHSPLLAWSPVLLIAAAGPPMLYLVAGKPEEADWRVRVKLIPGMILLGIGLAVNNSRAALAGLFSNKPGTFLRTPKFALEHAGERWEQSLYSLNLDAWVWVETALAAYALFALLLFTTQLDWGFIPWMLVYTMAFSYVGGLTLVQAIRRTRRLRSHVPQEVKAKERFSEIQ